MSLEIGIWEIAVLSLLREAPMHPYQMRRLLTLRHKDEILALKRGSLYHAIGRLLRAEFIAVDAVEREGRRPERTVYRITEGGLKELFGALRNIVATPKRESSEFMAAMSFLVHLSPEEAVQRLRDRSGRLKREIDGLVAGLADASSHVLRINLVESEYLLAMLRAELAWVQALEHDIETGKLNWDSELIFSEVRASRDDGAGKEQQR